jgi:hypothetical protein
VHLLEGLLVEERAQSTLAGGECGSQRGSELESGQEVIKVSACMHGVMHGEFVLQ